MSGSERLVVDATRLAIDEINKARGVLGRQVEANRDCAKETADRNRSLGRPVQRACRISIAIS